MPRQLRNIPDAERSWTIPEFCVAEGITPPTYYELKKQNLGPEELRYLRVVRITPAARAEWHKKMQSAKAKRAANIEAQRMAARARLAAKASVASKNHVTKRGRNSDRATLR
jgi:hypothetical protein